MITEKKKSLKRTPNAYLLDLRCVNPDDLKPKRIISLASYELTCEARTQRPVFASTTKQPEPSLDYGHFPSDEPNIIYEVTSSRPPFFDPNEARNSLNNMDSMIVGIVVGVVAFVCLLILIICVIKVSETLKIIQEKIIEKIRFFSYVEITQRRNFTAILN